MASESVGCSITSTISDALPSWLGGTGGGLTECEQLALTQTEASDIVAASDNTISSEQATQTAQGDVKTGMQVPVPQTNCGSFSDLSQYSAFSLSWWTCLQQALKKYALWIGLALLALLVILAWAYGGFRR